MTIVVSCDINDKPAAADAAAAAAPAAPAAPAEAWCSGLLSASS